MFITFFSAFIFSALLALFPFKLWWLSGCFLIPTFYAAFNTKVHFSKLFFLSLFTGLTYYGIASFWLTQYSFKYYLIMAGILTWLFPIYFCLIRIIYKGFQKRFPILISFLVWFLIYQIFVYSPFRTIAIDFPFLGTPLMFLQGIKWGGFVSWILLLIGFQVSASLFILQDRGLRIKALVFFVGCILLNGIYGYLELRESPKKPQDKIALIQHNLSMDSNWRMENSEQILEHYRKAAKEAATKKPDLLVFPLYTLKQDFRRNPEAIGSIAREVGIPIITAGHSPEKANGNVFEERYHNLALFISKEGKLQEQYHSVAAPPEFSKQKSVVAEKYQILEIEFGKFGVLLCYEDTIPYLAKEAKKESAQALLALSNPGHFVNTIMPRIYLVQNQLRAIETGLPVYRLSTNGYSAVIDPKGRVLVKTDLKKRQILYTY